MIQQMISFFFFSFSSPPKASNFFAGDAANSGSFLLGRKEPDVPPIKDVNRTPISCRVFYLYNLILLIRSLVTEWIAVFIEQLHHRPILGLQAPLLSTELYQKPCQPSWEFPKKDADALEMNGPFLLCQRPRATHETHPIRSNTSKPHFALTLGTFHPERDVDAPMELVHLPANPRDLLGKIDFVPQDFTGLW